MQTVIIFQEINTELSPKIFIVEGDYAHLYDVYINMGLNEKLEDELTSLIYDSEGQYLNCPTTIEHVKEAIKNGAELIFCGFVA